MITSIQIEIVKPFSFSFLARIWTAYMLSALYAIARPSVCPSHGRILQKPVEVRIMKFLPYGSPMTLVFAR